MLHISVLDSPENGASSGHYIHERHETVRSDVHIFTVDLQARYIRMHQLARILDQLFLELDPQAAGLSREGGLAYRHGIPLESAERAGAIRYDRPCVLMDKDLPQPSIADAGRDARAIEGFHFKGRSRCRILWKPANGFQLTVLEHLLQSTAQQLEYNTGIITRATLGGGSRVMRSGLRPNLTVMLEIPASVNSDMEIGLRTEFNHLLRTQLALYFGIADKGNPAGKRPIMRIHIDHPLT